MKPARLSALTGLLLAAGCSIFALAACASGPARSPRQPVVPILPVDDAEIEAHLQVPSPDWRDQVIYFILTDRFDDGDRSNNDQGAGVYNPRLNSHYSGGDLKGILNNLDYIKGLGATAVWVTPPVANQWYDPWINYTGYHGYWAENFSEVDKHYGSLDDYRRLSATLHRNGMYLIQDIVVNHTGNFFRYRGPIDRRNPALSWFANEESRPVTAPSQVPFSLNNPNRAEDREAAIYHWTRDIALYNDELQVKTWQVSGLDDLNTTNPTVRRAFRQIFGDWIRKAGVDGFRIDTVKYVEPEFFPDFIYSEDPEAPGISRQAAALGKQNFFTYGEAWYNSESPRDETSDARAAVYAGTEAEPSLTAVLNFPLHEAIKAVFGEGAPTAHLAFRFETWQRLYRNWDQMPVFIDNHDATRFTAGSDFAGLRQALALLFTIPGVPVLYYGTEQELKETRAAMWPGGYGSQGRDSFNPESRGYRLVQQLTGLRQAHKVFTRGSLRTLASAEAGAGVFAYERAHEGRRVWVVFNTANEPILLDGLELGLKPGQALSLLWGDPLADEALRTNAAGRWDAELPARAVLILEAGAEAAAAPVQTGRLSLEVEPGRVFTADAPVGGAAEGLTEVQLLIDGALARPIPARLEAGRWSAAVPAGGLSLGHHHLTVRGRSGEGPWLVAKGVDVNVDLTFTRAVLHEDPAGDDKGPRGTYTYPTDATFTRQMDLRRVELLTGGRNLKIRITPEGPITTSWSPKLGFDHVHYFVYIQRPDLPGGAAVLPSLNAPAPAGLRWHYSGFFGGWNSFWFHHQGADAKSYGTPAQPVPSIRVDREANYVELLIPAESLGRPETLSGIKVYISTWDYDGLESANRRLGALAKAYEMGGGAATDPLIMDDTPVLTLP